MMMTTGGTGRCTTHCENASGRPAKPRKRTKMRMPQMIAKIITVSLAVSRSASLSWETFMRFMSATTNTTKAPSAPASVGVAHPKNIAEKMITITPMTGSVPGNDVMRWLHV